MATKLMPGTASGNVFMYIKETPTILDMTNRCIRSNDTKREAANELLTQLQRRGLYSSIDNIFFNKSNLYDAIRGL